MAVKRRIADSSSAPLPIVWNTENELKLFKAALKFKPAGVIKHFNMALILNELVKGGMKDATSSAIWDHLTQLYNLESVNQIEKNSLNLEFSENEFTLPKKDFSEIMNEMKKVDEPVEVKEDVSSKKTSQPSVTDTPKTGTKRPTRSTPGSGASSAKRRK